MYQYEIIENHQLFEEFVKDVFNLLYKNNSFQLYKDKGMTQQGIDIYSPKEKVVIQCKKKDIRRSDKEIIAELISDLNSSIQKVVESELDFNSFVLATTTKKYSKIQDHINEVSKNKNFQIYFYSWKELEKHISESEYIRKKYYPHLAKPESKKNTAKQEISNSTINGNVIQNNIFNKGQKLNISILPPIKSIGANSLLKEKIISLFNSIALEREKEYGKSAYSVMYKKFKKDFIIPDSEKWTIIWTWPEGCATEIITYLQGKFNNTKKGRIKKAYNEKYIPTRPYLYAKEKELLEQIGLEIKSSEVKQLLIKYFNVDSHIKLTHLEHWKWICYLEDMIKNEYNLS